MSVDDHFLVGRRPTVVAEDTLMMDMEERRREKGGKYRQER
jgi:hypothetical protein